MEDLKIEKLLFLGEYLNTEYTVGKNINCGGYEEITEIKVHEKQYSEDRWYFEIYSETQLLATVCGNNKVHIHYAKVKTKGK